MREILFRGQRVSDSSWVYGGIMKTFHPNYDCSEKEFSNETPNCYCLCANNKDYFVYQNTIGQFTGLVDKNGKKIFEGDIVYLDVSNIYATVQVVFQDGAFGYLYPMTETEFDFMSFSDSEYGIDTQKSVEILGNIYDNKNIKLCRDKDK